MARLILVIGLIAAAVGLGSAAYGVWTIWNQHHAITSAVPVKAKVLSHDTKDLKGGGFVAKVPLVKYEYTVNQQPYTSDRVTPDELMLPNTWADSVFAQFPVGAEVEARHDPEDPAQAFLLAKYSIKPYLPLLVGLAIAGIGLAIVGDQLTTHEAPALTPTPSGGFALTAKQHHLANARVLGLVGLLGLVAGGPAIVHHLMVSTAPHERMGFLMEGAFAIAVLFVLGRAAMSFRQGRGFGTPVVAVDRPPTVGQPLRIRASVPTRFNGTASLRACLKCEAKDTRIFNASEENSDTVLMEQHLPLVPTTAALPEGEMAGQAELTIPPDMPPTTPADAGGTTQAVWTLILTAEANGGRKAETEYSLTVVKEGMV